jgi:serine/threonine-protein kinase
MSAGSPPLLERPSNMRITLTSTAGPHKGNSFSFVGHDTFVVGRSKQAHFHLPLDDRFFSRIHFLFEVNPPQCRILDMGSRNGTYVNQKRVQRADLKDGDQIQAGRTLLRVSLDELPAERAFETVVSTSARAPGYAEPAPPTAPPQQPVCLICGAPFANRKESFVNGVLVPCDDCRRRIAEQTQFIPGLQLVREIGRGAMGIVHLAIRSADGLPVAVKTITPAVAGTPKQLERFLREAEILQALRHPNIVAFREMGEAHGILYFAMDYVPGRNASQIVQKEGPLPINRAVRIICQALDALAFAHAQGFVHRDVKPANLLVTEQDGTETVKLADFGLARLYHSSPLSGLTLLGEVGGTLNYMAPEQITSFRDARPPADQYGAAATLYHILTASTVFDLPDVREEAFLMILEGKQVPIRRRCRDVSEELAKIIHRGLHRDPRKRFPDASAMKATLKSLST